MSRAAVPLSVGVALLGVGAMLERWWPDVATVPFGLGLCFLVLGIYRLVDRLERQ